MRRLVPLLLVTSIASVVAGCGGAATSSRPPARTPPARASRTTKTSSGPAATTRSAATATTHSAPTSTRPRPVTLSHRGWRRYTGPVPILVYHELGPVPAGAPFPGLYVSDADFQAEMAWLHAHGYTAVTLNRLMEGWYHQGLLPRKPIVITFDNGYPPQVTFAPKVMARYGWPGVLNEITEDHLHPSSIRHVLRMGWEVDSHSLTHPDLTELSGSDLTAQVTGSRRWLQRTFHIPVNSFCYPSSKYDAAVLAAVKAAGYKDATTETAGYATRADPYLLDRFEIEGGVSELAADLASPH